MTQPTQPLTDDLGAAVPVPPVVRRIVSLVPSLTEAVAGSGGADRLVGVTGYCTHPPEVVADLPRVGGTKNPDVARVVALRPDLVVANEEENRAADLEALRSAGLAVWVTAPRTVPAALDALDRMLRACGLGDPAWLAEAQRVWAGPVPAARRTAVVPIWRRPWMALGRDTFAGDVLARLGVRHLHAGHAERYPRFSPAEVRDTVDLVVLPDEPYAFAERDLDAFAGWPVEVAFVSGRHLTWYGPSLVEARSLLAGQLAAARPAPPSAGQAG